MTQANAEALTLEWEAETPPEKESGVVLIPSNRQTHAMNSTPHLGEAQRPIGRAFQVVSAAGELLPLAYPDISAGLDAMKIAGMGASLVRSDDMKCMAIMAGQGTNAARVAGRGKSVTARLLADAIEAQESAWPVSAREDEEP